MNVSPSPSAALKPEPASHPITSTAGKAPSKIVVVQRDVVRAGKLMASNTAITHRIQPTGFRGRRVAVRAPNKR